MIGLPRSTYYYRPITCDNGLTDAELLEAILAIKDDFPAYGYRRVTQELRRRGRKVNHKRVARLMKTFGLGAKPNRRFVRTTDSDHLK